MRNAFIRQFKKEAERDERIILLAADIGAIVFDEFRAARPKQFINVGVAESNMIGVATGLALNGYIPFCYTIVPFAIMRNFEHIRVDVCIQNTNVKIVGVGAGVSYSLLGPTHHSIEDIAIMRALPNMSIVSPADAIETEYAVADLTRRAGPAYLRLGVAGEPIIHKSSKYKFNFGKPEKRVAGDDITIISTGYMLNIALQAAEILTSENVKIEIINVSTIKPLDKNIILKSLEKTGVAMSIEEHNIYGGLGSVVSEMISESNFRKPMKFKRIGINDIYNFNYGSREYLLEVNKLTAKHIANEIRGLLKSKKSLENIQSH